MWRKIIPAVVATGTALYLGFLIVPHGPAVKSGENGTFSNDCCGTFELSDGKMILNDQKTVPYSVAADANGPYILPSTDVATIPDHGFAVDGSRSVRKLRLDRLPSPTRITLYEGIIPYVFTRKASHLRE